MSSLISLVGLVCVCSVAVSIISVVRPEGFTSKTMNMIAGVFAVAAVLIPLTNIVKDSSFDFHLPSTVPEYSDNAQSSFDQAVLDETAKQLEAEHFDLLISEGYNIKRIHFYLSVNDDSVIKIDSVSIYIDEAEKRSSEIIKLIRDSCGVVPQLIEE